MRNINIIIIYLGSNIKDFVVSIFLKFILYMSLLTIILITFFSSDNIVNSKLFTILTIAFLIIMNFLINRMIMIHHSLNLLRKFPEDENNCILIKRKLRLKEWKQTRKRVTITLNNMIHGYVTTEFTDCMTIMNMISTDIPESVQEEVGELYRDHIRQRFVEAGISLLTIFPFFSISILLTAGYKYELRMLSVILAIIFYLFIRSAIITPLFSLITLHKIAERVNT